MCTRAIFLCRFDSHYTECTVFHCRRYRICFFPTRRALCIVCRNDFSGGGPKRCRHRPVFFRDKCSDLVLSIANRTGRYGLYTSGRQAALDIFPQERAEFIADNAIQDAPRLLRIHKLLIDGARMLDGIFHRRFCNFIESDATSTVHRNPEGIRQMPRNGFTFSVRVRREIDFGGILRILFQLRDDVTFPADIDVVRRKTVFNIDAERTFGQITNVPLGSNDFVVGAQVAFDGGRLSRRLDDY